MAQQKVRISEYRVSNPQWDAFRTEVLDSGDYIVAWRWCRMARPCGGRLVLVGEVR